MRAWFGLALVAASLLAGACLLFASRSNRAAPPALSDASAWRWAAAEPGSNVYLSSGALERDGTAVVLWVDHRYFGSLAGIDADRVELREFDCSRGVFRRIRWVGDARGAASSVLAVATTRWRAPRGDKTDEALFSLACLPVIP